MGKLNIVSKKKILIRTFVHFSFSGFYTNSEPFLVVLQPVAAYHGETPPLVVAVTWLIESQVERANWENPTPSGSPVKV